MSPSPVRQERTSASEGSALQNQITELLEGEQSNPPIVPRSRLPAFLSEVLLNIDQIRTHSGSFLAALRLLQERDADANAVGDLVERAALEWGPAYHEYITRLPLADQRLRQEKTENPAFRDFLELFHDNPKACKRGFDTFHSRPTFRALRYILLLESILERCGTGGLRPASVERALVILRRQSAEADREIERTKQAAALRDLDHSFLFREDVVQDLNLRSPTRRLLHSGPVIWQLASGDQRSGFAFLFDHFLVFSKPPRPDREGRLRYIIKRRPVPLALVQLEPSSQPSATPSEPKHSFEGRSATPRKFKIMQLYSLAGVPLRIEILQGHLALYHRHHIEVMDMETMRTLTVPDLLPVPTDDLLPLVHLSEGGLVLGLFRAVKDRHLLVFDLASPTGSCEGLAGLWSFT
ncbi:hypothetical protein B0A53_02020 [Rhodotorula sp. CCFEE 5036]|nr:hypothetical protein B0A53_02020 [Rhodotorula sp. CCFEE 5036]